MEKKNLHKDHRKRVREQYLKIGIDNMAEHNVLELLLFYGVPYKDTNGIAHELIERFGSIEGVLIAPYEELVKISGLGENSAILLKLINDIVLQCAENKLADKNIIVTEKEFFDYLVMKYRDKRKESVYLLCVDSKGRLTRCMKVCDGSPDSVSVDNRTIVEAALHSGSKDIILAHNHPNGFAVPSIADVRSTETLIPLLRAIDVNLTDHVIVADDDCFSMAMSKKYEYLFN